MLELFHYTNKGGFDALTSGEVDWLPSLGIPHSAFSSGAPRPLPRREDLFPPPEFFEKRKRGMSDIVAVAAAVAAVPFHHRMPTYAPNINGQRYGLRSRLVRDRFAS